MNDTFDSISKISFRVEFLYIQTAKRAIEAAESLWPKIELEIRNLREMESTYKLTSAALEMDFDGQRPERSKDPAAIALADKSTSIGLLYRPLLEQLAIAQLMSANSLESYVNGVAEDTLASGDRECFRNMPLSAKCLFLPAIAGIERLAPGREPLLSLRNLVRWRNELVHYRHPSEAWDSQIVPTFLKDLGLDIRDARKSIDAVGEYALHVQESLGRPMKGWLDDDVEYFEWEFTF